MKDFIELIKENAKKYPKRLAVIDGERKISYAQFYTLINSISHQLLTIKLKPKVVIDLTQGIDAYALIVAVLNIGGTYCPLNTDAPIERKMQIISEFSPDLIIVDSDEKRINANSEKVIKIDTLLKTSIYNEIVIDFKDESIIYVIYTSGSTGIPKGVMICRKALNKFLEWAIPTYGANENDIWGQFSFLSFDLSIVDIFTCLCSGATLFSMNDLLAKKYRPASLIEKVKITIWHSIPSAVEFMIVNEKSKKYDFSSLRIMSFCGEPLRKHQVEFLFKKKSNLILLNTYGPTEGTLFCTWQELKSDNYLDYCDFTISIGKPLPGWNIQLNAVDYFIEREIFIYGDFIGMGYMGNVSDTKFKEMKIEGKIEKVFETGDMVTEQNGNLYFSCRKDRQVKIKGFRIELDEIDFRINEFLNRTSVTVVKNDSLYSFIECEEILNESGLRNYLKRKMETYKIPNVFYPIRELPRNQNQKVDIKALIELIP